MTHEEMERAMEFVVKQQAEFSTDLQKLAAVHTRTEQTLGTVVTVLSQVAENQLHMAEAQKEMAETQKRTDEVVAETNERLNSLIVVVERYFSNGRREN